MATPKKTADAAETAAQVTFRDTAYTSRVLILTKGRQLPVERGLVTVAADDAEALQFLQAHPDLKPLQE
ncbi:hypothetical protein N5D52_10160 [Pseudomonas sp. GD03860]|uniref:hypothetical protein n=1 Tax=Pseudomonas TaxID=286 RepID=UPI0023637B25|nr:MULTISPECIES: hypothetical protein [Pseudomonas]MDD2056325.1 hypothetical protein [Pseudomonas putida]MDD2059142.1 hypothetical protein [Pseudomonas putida]MDH0637306.1 hypothetical protein [Pseudomonas sp. GD03860]